MVQKAHTRCLTLLPACALWKHLAGVSPVGALHAQILSCTAAALPENPLRSQSLGSPLPASLHVVNKGPRAPVLGERTMCPPGMCVRRHQPAQTNGLPDPAQALSLSKTLSSGRGRWTNMQCKMSPFAHVAGMTSEGPRGSRIVCGPQ